MATRSRVEAIVSSIITVHPNEIPALIHSAACFFFLLSAYFVILPLRDDGAISLGLNSLPGLFVGSLLLTLVAAPVSTLVFSLPNLSKPRALVLIHRFFSMSLLAFFVLWYASSTERQLSSSKVSDSHPSLYKNENDNAGQDGPTHSGGWVNHGWFYIFVRIGLFLWVALLNLITISSTWARVIDVMDSESGSRLFGFVGAGATLGQLFGSLFAASMAWLGPFLLLFSALFMELAAQSSKGIIQDARYISEELSPMREDVRDQNTETGDETVSALVQSSPKSPTYIVKPRLCVMLEGLWLIMSSTYLLYVSLFLWLSAVVSSFFYFQKVTIIAMSVTSPLARRRLFALINSSIAVFILAGQLTLTGRILTVAGVTVAICSAPFVAIVNLVALDVWPTWLTVAISETLRKVTTYVVTRPGREILFTVVSQDEKYKAKKHHCSEEGELMQVGEETRRLEMDLTVKERETLDVLKELEMTKRVVDGLKLKLQEATPEVVKIPELNPDTMKVQMNHVESIGPKQQHPGMILMELKQAKMNLNRTTSGLAGIRASVELLKSQIEEEKLLLGETRERLSSNIAVISSLEEEVNRAQLDLQIIKDAKQMNPDPEVSKLSAEIDSMMASVKTVEIRLLAARKMEVAAKVALEKIKALPTNAADVMILPMREYTMLTLKAREAEEISRKKIEAAMLRVEEANQSKRELLTKVEEATLEVETSRKALEEALKREEDANRGKLAVETALRRWRSEQAQKRRCSTKFKNPYPNRRMLDVNGLSLAPSGPALLSIGEILSRKLNGPEEYEAAIQEKMNRKPKVSLGQILSSRHGLLSPQRTDDDDDKKSSEKRKRLGFSFHFGKHIKKSKKKKRRPSWDPRVNCRPKLL